MKELPIHTQIHSQYQVLDASADDDPRVLHLEIAGSVLDIPYALAHGLLTIHEEDPPTNTLGGELDLSLLTEAPAKEAGYLSLPSPVYRTEHWRDSFTIHHCQIDFNGALASILEPGRKYTIRLASEDLGVRRWAYGEPPRINDSEENPNHDSDSPNLVNSKPTAGKATFKVAKYLPWPPIIETKMRLCAISESSDSTPSDAKSSNIFLEISVVNTGPQPVTVQTRGHQCFLIPWGPFQPESYTDARLRIIDPAPHKPPISSLQVVNCATGEVVGEDTQSSTSVLTTGSPDPRPKLTDVATLKPRIPLIRKVDIGALVDELADGQYKIQMLPKGCRWWHGEISEEESEDGRVPASWCDVIPPPLMLESQDEVGLRIRDGKVEKRS